MCLFGVSTFQPLFNPLLLQKSGFLVIFFTFFEFVPRITPHQIELEPWNEVCIQLSAQQKIRYWSTLIFSTSIKFSSRGTDHLFPSLTTPLHAVETLRCAFWESRLFAPLNPSYPHRWLGKKHRFFYNSCDCNLSRKSVTDLKNWILERDKRVYILDALAPLTLRKNIRAFMSADRPIIDV